MNRPMLEWALFCCVLVPVFLRTPNDPMWLTAAHIGACLVMVWLADRIERHKA